MNESDFDLRVVFKLVKQEFMFLFWKPYYQARYIIFRKNEPVAKKYIFSEKNSNDGLNKCFVHVSPTLDDGYDPPGHGGTEGS
jgi:hypothetical protein